MPNILYNNQNHLLLHLQNETSIINFETQKNDSWQSVSVTTKK